MEKIIQMPQKDVNALRRDIKQAIGLQEVGNWVNGKDAATILNRSIQTLYNRSKPGGNLKENVHWKKSLAGKLFNIAAIKGF